MYFKNNQIKIEISPIQLYLNSVLVNILIDNGLKLIETTYIEMTQMKDSVHKIYSLEHYDSINLQKLFATISL